MLKASFSIIESTEKYIVLRDNCIEFNTMSITNDAENVIKYLHQNFDITNKTVYYVDTEERVDKLLHKNGEFIGFEPEFDSFGEFSDKMFSNFVLKEKTIKR